jgi:hypothetical protein
LDVDGIGGSEGYGRLGFDLGNVGVGMEYGVGLRLEDLVLANYVGGRMVGDSGACPGIFISHLGNFVDWKIDLEFRIHALCLSR